MPYLLFLLHLLAWVFLLLLLWLWLRKELTPRRFLSIFETDGVLSARQVFAWVVGVWALAMRTAGRIDNETFRYALESVWVLFGIGGLVKAVGAIKPGTTVNAKKVEEMNLDNGPKPETP